MGVDYGLARTGLSVSDPEGRLAFPLTTLRLEDYADRKEFLAALVAGITAEGAGAVVMGLPLLDDGTDSLTTRQVRNFAASLKRRMNLPIYYMNEVLSSADAESRLAAAGLNARAIKDVIDQEAAALILESFLSQPESLRKEA